MAPLMNEKPSGRRSKDIGTVAETAVVRFLQRNGWPSAERRALRGEHDAGDVTGTPGVAWEVKGGKAAKVASDMQVQKWLGETERERINAGADVGVLVMQRGGYGPARCGMWWAVLSLRWLMPQADQISSTATVRLTLDDMCQVLRHRGWGDPL